MDTPPEALELLDWGFDLTRHRREAVREVAGALVRARSSLCRSGPVILRHLRSSHPARGKHRNDEAEARERDYAAERAKIQTAELPSPEGARLHVYLLPFFGQGTCICRATERLDLDCAHMISFGSVPARAQEVVAA